MVKKRQVKSIDAFFYFLFPYFRSKSVVLESPPPSLCSYFYVGGFVLLNPCHFWYERNIDGYWEVLVWLSLRINVLCGSSENHEVKKNSWNEVEIYLFGTCTFLWLNSSKFATVSCSFSLVLCKCFFEFGSFPE